MQTEIIVAVLSLAGTVLGSLGGIMVSSRLTTYRISELEKKVEKHNKVMERTFVLEEQIKVVNHRLSDLEAFEHETEKENRGVG